MLLKPPYQGSGVIWESGRGRMKLNQRSQKVIGTAFSIASRPPAAARLAGEEIPLCGKDM